MNIVKLPQIFRLLMDMVDDTRENLLDDQTVIHFNFFPSSHLVSYQFAASMSSEEQIGLQSFYETASHYPRPQYALCAM